MNPANRWTTEDARMLREQCRVADAAYNRLVDEHRALLLKNAELSSAASAFIMAQHNRYTALQRFTRAGKFQEYHERALKRLVAAINA